MFHGRKWRQMFGPIKSEINNFFRFSTGNTSHADLLIHKSEKMSLFDQKILEVAIDSRF